MKKIFACLLSMSLLLLVACSSTPTSQNSGEPTSKEESTSIEETTTEQESIAETTTEQETTEIVDDELTLGSTFEFDNLQITFGTDIQWATLDNKFSDINGADVFYLPITITNLKDETHGLNMFFYTQYGSSGTQLESVSLYYDNDVATVGDMRSGATQESIMHFLYDGDGDYYIEFNNFTEKIEVKIPVTK